MRRRHALATIVAVALSSIAACTIEDVRDDIRVVETVPRPSSGADTHRLTRTFGLGSDADRVDRGEFTGVRLTVVSPDDADLFPFLRIDLYVVTSEGSTLLAQGTDFARGERQRALEVQYTGNIKPFLQAEDLQIEWRIYYKSSEISSYPAAGIEIETVIGFSIDVEII